MNHKYEFQNYDAFNENVRNYDFCLLYIHFNTLIFQFFLENGIFCIEIQLDQKGRIALNLGSV